MIFDFILGQLDGELARLQQLRDIVAGLEGPAVVAVHVEPQPALVKTLSPHEPALPPARPRRKSVRTRMRPAHRSRLVLPTALTAAIPAGPVVVSAAALKEAAEHKLLPAAAPETPDVDPEALLRELSQRWGTGVTTHPA